MLQHGPTGEVGELFAPAEPGSATGRQHDRPGLSRARRLGLRRATTRAVGQAAGHDASPVTCAVASCFASTSAIKPAIASAASTTVSKGGSGQAAISMLCNVTTCTLGPRDRYTYKSNYCAG